MKLLILFLFSIIYLYGSILSPNVTPSNIINMSPLEPIEKTSYALLMDKSSYTLTLYERTNGSINKVKAYHAIFGKNIGDKFYQGDSRTPEGIYFIHEIKDEKELLPKYGKKALVLNYPNPMDRLNGKTGLGIWIHSVDDPQRLQLLNDTRGCVAISNQNIIELSAIVELQSTPVIIVNKPEYINEKTQLSQQAYFLNLLEKWKTAWINNNIEEYIAFYSDSFYSSAKKMNKKEWRAYKANLGTIYKNINVEIDNINIYNFSSYTAILFKQKYTSPNIQDTGKKIIYLEKTPDSYKIISESWFAFPSQEAVTVSKKD